MQPLKLINNKTNLCFVNSILQALRSLPEFRELCVTSKKKSPIGLEIFTLFQSGGNFSVSGHKLRR